ncbi:uncharacterized protein LOC133383007 [Rhineura floridana]|uniref:uncharacterized protein LOC133383007 n=1 Tax=Rhineura floridana TaxID=261503 RepID=UPI002AC82D60|nr:uncharacterized protein LOC133383007 [Rhineura floridana]
MLRHEWRMSAYLWVAGVLIHHAWPLCCPANVKICSDNDYYYLKDFGRTIPKTQDCPDPFLYDVDQIKEGMVKADIAGRLCHKAAVILQHNYTGSWVVHCIRVEIEWPIRLALRCRQYRPMPNYGCPPNVNVKSIRAEYNMLTFQTQDNRITFQPRITEKQKFCVGIGIPSCYAWLNDKLSAQKPVQKQVTQATHNIKTLGGFKQRNTKIGDGWDGNTFVALMEETAPKKGTCYVCAHTPPHGQAGVPLTGAPLPLKEYLSFASHSSSQELEGELVLSGPIARSVCVGSGSQPTGGMMCDGLIYSTNPGNWTFLNGTHRAEGLTWLSIWQHLLRLTFADHHLVPFLTDLVDHQTPAGLWWLCGHSAVRKLPVSGSWTCTLGRVVPGLRVSPTLPTLRRRNKRGTGEAVLRGFFPMYGAAKTYQELIELSQAFERFMNDSAISFSDLTNEQGQIRTVVLQNRLALDFLLSSHGGGLFVNREQMLYPYHGQQS